MAQAVRESGAAPAEDDEDEDEDDDDFEFELDVAELLRPGEEPAPPPPQTRAQRRRQPYQYQSKHDRPQFRKRPLLSTQRLQTGCGAHRAGVSHAPCACGTPHWYSLGRCAEGSSVCGARLSADGGAVRRARRADARPRRAGACRRCSRPAARPARRRRRPRTQSSACWCSWSRRGWACGCRCWPRRCCRRPRRPPPPGCPPSARSWPACSSATRSCWSRGSPRPCPPSARWRARRSRARRRSARRRGRPPAPLRRLMALRTQRPRCCSWSRAARRRQSHLRRWHTCGRGLVRLGMRQRRRLTPDCGRQQLRALRCQPRRLQRRAQEALGRPCRRRGPRRCTPGRPVVCGSRSPRLRCTACSPRCRCARGRSYMKRAGCDAAVRVPARRKPLHWRGSVV